MTAPGTPAWANRKAKRWTVRVTRTVTSDITVAAWTSEEAATKAETIADIDQCDWHSPGPATAVHVDEAGGE